MALTVVSIILLIASLIAFFLVFKPKSRFGNITVLALSAAGGAMGAFAAIAMRNGDSRKKRLRFFVIVLAMMQAFTLVMLILLTVYSAGYYRASGPAIQALESDDSVQVSRCDGWCTFFDGPGQDAALVFYPGALVDPNAYAPIAHRTAELGVDCFVIDVPYYLAFLDINAAERVMAKHDYQTWYVGGHSLGGVAASTYAQGHGEVVSGVVLLASYSTSHLPEGMGALSVFASEDGVINWENCQKSSKHLPSDAVEVVIEGGNHAQFGSYGEQAGDNPATVSEDDQHEQTAQAIAKYCL